MANSGRKNPLRSGETKTNGIRTTSKNKQSRRKREFTKDELQSQIEKDCSLNFCEHPNTCIQCGCQYKI